MVSEREKDRRAMDKRYVRSKRHTIQVDGPPYMRQLARERKKRRLKSAHPATREPELQTA
jgi:hypothetical protein